MLSTVIDLSSGETVALHRRIDRHRHRRLTAHGGYMVDETKSSVAARLDVQDDALPRRIGPHPGGADAELCVRLTRATHDHQKREDADQSFGG